MYIFFIKDVFARNILNPYFGQNLHKYDIGIKPYGTAAPSDPASARADRTEFHRA